MFTLTSLQGPLAKEVPGEQVKQLVRALFQNTERRAALLAKIKQITINSLNLYRSVSIEIATTKVELGSIVKVKHSNPDLNNSGGSRTDLKPMDYDGI